MNPYDEQMTRIPPSDRMAEVCVLGSMILDNRCIDDVGAGLCADEFYLPAHALIFKALCDMQTTGGTIDLVLLRDELTRRGELETVGGVDYLVEIVDGVPATTNVDAYAAIVRAMATKRAMIRLTTNLCRDAYEPGVLAADLVTAAEKGVYEIANGRAGLGLVKASDAADIVIEHLGSADPQVKTTGIMTGLEALDSACGGMHGSELIVLAADTGMGKTSLADTITLNVAHNGGRVLVVSVEMSHTERAQRFLMSMGDVGGHKFRKPYLITEEDWTNLYGAAGRLTNMQIRIHWGNATTSQVVSQARRSAAQMGGLDLVVVDYLQLLKPEPDQGRTRAEKIATMAWALKMNVAMDLDVPVLLLSQLTRSSVKAGEHPTLHDLKESGDIENHANAIWLLDRIPGAKAEPGCSVTALNQDKHRSMPRTTWTGDTAIRLEWKRSTTTFTRAYWDV